jgi:hypothetical protein
LGNRGLIFLSAYPSRGRTAPSLSFGFSFCIRISVLESRIHHHMFLFPAPDLSSPNFAAQLLVWYRGRCRHPGVDFLSSWVSPLAFFSWRRCFGSAATANLLHCCAGPRSRSLLAGSHTPVCRTEFLCCRSKGCPCSSFLGGCVGE